MKKNYAIFTLMLIVSLLSFLSGCKKEGDKVVPTIINDYLPLKVGAKYKYNYSASYTYVSESSIKQGECTWTFISKSVDTPVVYQVEQSFNGYYVYRNYYGRKDSSHIENQISTLSFEVLNDGKVAFTFPVPYWGDSKAIFERFIKSDIPDTCFILQPIINQGCLRKDVGITNLFYVSCGNHCSIVNYSLIEGPSY